MFLTANMTPGKPSQTTTHTTLSKIINVTTQQHRQRRPPQEVQPWAALQARNWLTVPDTTMIALDMRPALNNSRMIPRVAELTREIMQLVVATGAVEESTTLSLVAEAAMGCTDSMRT
jgi:hypothetical protein